MKGLYESIRQKELELQRALHDAAEANERELRRIQKSLQDALGAVDQLLGAAKTAEPDVASPLSTSTVTSIESKSVERINDPPSLPDPRKVMRSSQSAIAACFGDAAVREFP